MGHQQKKKRGDGTERRRKISDSPCAEKQKFLSSWKEAHERRTQKGGAKENFWTDRWRDQVFFLWLQLLICHPKTDNWVTTQPLPQMWRQFFFLFRVVLTKRERKVFSIPQNFPFFLCPLKTGEAFFSFSPSPSPLFPSSFLRRQGHPSSSSFYSKSQRPLFSPPPPSQPPPKKVGLCSTKEAINWSKRAVGWRFPSSSGRHRRHPPLPLFSPPLPLSRQSQGRKLIFAVTPLPSREKQWKIIPRLGGSKVQVGPKVRTFAGPDCDTCFLNVEPVLRGLGGLWCDSSNLLRPFSRPSRQTGKRSLFFSDFLCKFINICSHRNSKMNYN